jgi:hypothetical protein
MSCDLGVSEVYEIHDRDLFTKFVNGSYFVVVGCVT